MIGGAITVVCITIFTIISFLTVCMRCVVRFVIVKNHGIDDILIMFASCCSIVFAILIYFQVQHGLGGPIYENFGYHFRLMMMGFYACLPFYHCGLALVKISILFQYLRFFPPSRSRSICWIMIWFTAAYTVAALIWGFTLCIPISYVWDKSIQGVCPLTRAAYATAGVAILSDLGIMILPLWVLRGLNMPRRQKFGLLGVFALGGISCIMAAIRVPAITITVDSPVLGADNNGSALWSGIEMNVGMTAACLPTLRPLILRVIPGRFYKSIGSDSTTAVEESGVTIGRKGQRPIQSIHGLTRQDIEGSDNVLGWPLETVKSGVEI